MRCRVKEQERKKSAMKIAVKIVISFLCILPITGYAEVAVKTILAAPFGKELRQFGKSDADELNEDMKYPTGLAAGNFKFYIGDCYNLRMQIYDFSATHRRKFSIR
jgi:hypothetical protein